MRILILAAEFLAACSLAGCLGEDENAVLSDFQKQELFDSLQDVWSKGVVGGVAQLKLRKNDGQVWVFYHGK